MIKKGTKFICINNSNVYAKQSQKYGCRCKRKNKRHLISSVERKLTINNIYEQIEDSTWIRIKNDNGYIDFYENYRFISMANFRENKINEIFNDTL